MFDTSERSREAGLEHSITDFEPELEIRRIESIKPNAANPIPIEPSHELPKGRSPFTETTVKTNG
jgi:hypothetical protein